MHYASIKKYDIANGEGVRISLFVSGCPHHCKNCFNEEAWDYTYGNLFTKNSISFGYTFSPFFNTITSFILPVIYKYPSLSK